jgi:hypothetical protein
MLMVGPAQTHIRAAVWNYMAGRAVVMGNVCHQTSAVSSNQVHSKARLHAISE